MQQSNRRCTIVITADALMQQSSNRRHDVAVTTDTITSSYPPRRRRLAADATIKSSIASPQMQSTMTADTDADAGPFRQ
jgi:hypothetical protein